MSRTRRRRAGTAAALLAVALLGAGCAGDGERTIRIAMRTSRFVPDEVRVRAGERVRFVVVNEDPIAHEIVFGDEAVQQEHERGAHATHDGAPGQASLEAGETDEVVFTFDQPGEILYGCHLPGHYAYGMRGVVRVED